MDERLRRLIVLASASEVVELLNDQTVSSVQLLLVRVREACELNREHNLLCDELFEVALEQAKHCDQIRR